MVANAARLALTVDLEFFDSPFGFHGIEPPEEATELGRDGVSFVAELLAEHDVSATWFVLGELAERHPELVRDLAEQGHEIASHGYSISHPDNRELEPAALDDELQRSKAVLADVTGDRIRGFRAPAFSVNERVLDAVADAGYDYDSSIVPSRKIPGFYGFPDAPDTPYTGTHVVGEDLRELPVSVAPWLRVPISGAWIRLLGRRYATWGLRRQLERHGYGMLYVHPWELVDVPQFDGIPRRVSFRTGSYVRRTIETIVETYADQLTTAEAIVDE